MTRDLLALPDWRQASGVTHVAMESTGVLWKPVFNILEGSFVLWLVNPRHIKKVPGLLTGSFVPPRGQRELRDLTRRRAQLVTVPKMSLGPLGVLIPARGCDGRRSDANCCRYSGCVDFHAVKARL